MSSSPRHDDHDDDRSTELVEPLRTEKSRDERDTTGTGEPVTPTVSSAEGEPQQQTITSRGTIPAPPPPPPSPQPKPMPIDDGEFASSSPAPIPASPPSQPHVPLKDDDNNEDEEDDDEDAIPYPTPSAQHALQPPSDFHPFFTVIENPITGDHHHPTHVHYIFADDDPDLLTNAALASLNEEGEGGDDGERVVIVDISADGREVVSAASLSPAWQAVHPRITQAPSWGSNSDEEGVMGEGEGDRERERDKAKKGKKLMLRISGQEATARGAVGESQQQRRRDFEALIKAFDESCGPLEAVLGATGGSGRTEPA